ncbi:YceI family protein [Sinomicrobium weinanense]|uniref:YceI family protein n=1 Tax=Sinomicrobium weinanense TaxID=2842200 RepID=A0A926Q4E3_9FLAO|nr:YceI family protein [Sinomicrobium weinanense]MBC9796991.1 YceI family protein [Sinomicrobium weinanense]MBU3122170.1 YceI family protein [Sinomicrobium weinanense]
MGRPGIHRRLKHSGVLICLLTIFLVSAIPSLQAQKKYITRTGEIHFEASVPSFEEVDARTKSASAVLEASTGEFAALVLIKSFRFKVALMEEHFNENYVMSDDYPKASFRGRIEEFNAASLGDRPEKYHISGELTVRGTTKEMNIPATLRKTGDKIILNSTFTTTPGDFGIKIPGIVRNKIAREVVVDVHFELH